MELQVCLCLLLLLLLAFFKPNFKCRCLLVCMQTDGHLYLNLFSGSLKNRRVKLAKTFEKVPYTPLQEG
jgi:hypothetical protein